MFADKHRDKAEQVLLLYTGQTYSLDKIAFKSDTINWIEMNIAVLHNHDQPNEYFSYNAVIYCKEDEDHIHLRPASLEQTGNPDTVNIHTGLAGVFIVLRNMYDGKAHFIVTQSIKSLEVRR